ncbi:MAG: CDGSH iron-sulfur domain-containing protein [Sphaerobacteraceae bacterium]|nr:MAG: CDGSH iron-sulfur domain-containing protein [Sphaerobacteraceae bacterium]
MADVNIRVNRNGPYLVTGKVTIEDHKGNQVIVEGDDVALCRCAESKNKPFCDGSHRDCDFKGEKAAVAEHNILQVEDNNS